MKKVHLALCFKDFACWLINASSVGLNVAGYTTAKVLIDNGIDTSVFPVRNNIDLVNSIDKYNETHSERLTHVVISAPWLSVYDLKSLLKQYRDIHFVVMSHSNVGFLQADSHGVELLREYMKLGDSNFSLGGNSVKFCIWADIAYQQDTVLLPNLYSVRQAIATKLWDRGPIKIGAFGAVRPYKNFMTAAGAALAISRVLDRPVEFHMSSGGEGDQNMIAPAIEAMLKDTDVVLIKHDWSYWHNFIKLVGSMDLLLQPSYTESFNLVTADGILVGVPSVVSEAINWAPNEWKADSDNALDVAYTGMELLCQKPSRAGIKALEAHNKLGIRAWEHFLGLEKLNWLERIIGGI